MWMHRNQRVTLEFCNKMVDRGIWNIRFNYNQGDYKVFQTNQAVIRGRNDPHEWNFTDKKIWYLIISISEMRWVPQGSFIVYKVNRHDPFGHFLFQGGRNPSYKANTYIQYDAR